MQASVKLQPAHQYLTRERAESEEDGRPEPALLADGPLQFGDLEQFYHVLKLSVQLSTPPPRSSQTPGGGSGKNDDFYANVGNAIRTLREEIPRLFQQDFTYDIYREDIVFRDPRNTFKGLKNYKTIFWSLRFHGRLFFSRLYVDVQRIWQPDEAQIRMRWTVHGIPRVPWKAEGVFDGVSTFKLDRTGKIYEHQVNNVILRDPPMLRSPLFAGLNLTPLLQPQPQAQPCPGAWCNNASSAATDALDSQAQSSSPQQPALLAATTQQQAEQAEGSRTRDMMQGVREVIAKDAAYLRRAFSDREVSLLLCQDQFTQPPCQT